MVYLVSCQIRVYKYCGFYNSAAPVCDDRRRNLFSGFADPDYLFVDTVFYRTCSGGVYNHASGASPDWKCDHAEPWYNRILYCQDL